MTSSLTAPESGEPIEEAKRAVARLDLVHRPRRNRKAEWTRKLVREHVLTSGDLIWPIFLVEGRGVRTPVASMARRRAAFGRRGGRGGARGRKPRHSRHRALSLHGAGATQPVGQRSAERSEPRLPGLRRDQARRPGHRPRHGCRARPLYEPRPRRDFARRGDRQRRDGRDPRAPGPQPSARRGGRDLALRHDGRPRRRHPRGA